MEIKFVKLINLIYQLYELICEDSNRLVIKTLKYIFYILNVRYMQKNASSLFNVSDYSVAPPEYHRKAI